jgi:valyl-tRNA synthetase
MNEPNASDRAIGLSIPTAYDPQPVEARWYAEWERRGYFGATPNSGREPFCIVLPPPNVTGALHIGHAFQQLLQDMVIRRKRMQGFETLWLPGTDHAGIATQVVVERQLAEEGIDRKQIGREAFVQRVWEWKEQYGGRIVEQMRALGNSCDWSRLRFTMDQGLARAVRVAFVRMYEKGLIYRGERIINWCPRDTTALSDSEVEHEDVEGELITFRYDLTDGSGHIDVATTRIETMLGDTGVAVHPSDQRYGALVGKKVRHPFSARELPIVADDAVDPSFGTGAVKVTPAHDPTDFDIGQRHDLPTINILTAEARISDQAPEEFRGLDRYAARARVLERLQEMGKVVNVERPYVHSVGRCYRCETEIEPWLGGKQWFVSVERLKGPAREAALAARITFFPARWIHPYTQWLDGLRDWNISRQLWWGHRIPVWYCPNEHQIVSVEDPDRCDVCGSTELEQDPDVLDTWFSSQLWPYSTLGWPEETDDLRFFYPTSALITGYEILYLWVARMIMSGLFLVGEVPFHHVVIHGLVRDPLGRKMSKSLGNVIDPLGAIAASGADALRFGLAYQATDAQNIPFGEEHIDGGRRFANKIWNAARLVMSAREGPIGNPVLPDSSRWTPSDRWLLSRHQACLDEVDRLFDEYRFADVARVLYHFFWSELCDWGLEAAKVRLYEGSPGERRDAAEVLSWVLERSLRLLHPIMPFVTEEVWQRFEAGDSIMVAPWPERLDDHTDKEAEAEFGSAMSLVTAVRKFRKDHGLRDSVPLPVHVYAPEASPRAAWQRLRHEIERMAGISSLEVSEVPGDPADSARLVAAGAQVLIPLAGLFDRQAERARLAKRIADIERSVTQSEGKLANEAFVAKAPHEVVAKERRKLAQLQAEQAELAAQLEELG